MIPETLPERIRRLIRERIKSGDIAYKSEAAVLDAAELSSGWLSERISAAKKSPEAGINDKTASRLAAVLKISVGELLGDSKESGLPGPLPDTLALAREAVPSLMKRRKLSEKDAWFEFYEFPVAAHKGERLTSAFMLDWALDRHEKKAHPAGDRALGAESGPKRRRDKAK